MCIWQLLATCNRLSRAWKNATFTKKTDVDWVHTVKCEQHTEMVAHTHNTVNNSYFHISKHASCSDNKLLTVKSSGKIFQPICFKFNQKEASCKKSALTNKKRCKLRARSVVHFTFQCYCTLRRAQYLPPPSCGLIYCAWIQCRNSKWPSALLFAARLSPQ